MTEVATTQLGFITIVMQYLMVRCSCGMTGGTRGVAQLASNRGRTTDQGIAANAGYMAGLAIWMDIVGRRTDHRSGMTVYTW